MEYNRLTRIYTYSWTFRSIEMVNKALKATVSRIYSDLPFTLKKVENSQNIKETFQPLYDNLSNVISKLDFISFEMEKTIKEKAKELQVVGAFLNDRLVQDQLAVQSQKYVIIEDQLRNFFIDLLKHYDLYQKQAPDHKPSVLEAYIILSQRAELCNLILEKSKEIINRTINEYEANQNGIKTTNIECFKSVIKDIEACYEDFSKFIARMKEIFKEGSEQVINALNELCIPIEENLEDPKLYLGSILNEIKCTYAQVCEINSPNAAFKKLYDNNVNARMEAVENNKETEFVRIPNEK